MLNFYHTQSRKKFTLSAYRKGGDKNDAKLAFVKSFAGLLINNLGNMVF